MGQPSNEDNGLSVAVAAVAANGVTAVKAALCITADTQKHALEVHPRPFKAQDNG